MKPTCDVLVLGLGAMGSAALYQLAKRGVRALGIDQYTPPHAHGSSHGETRITRQAIGEGTAYTPFALRSNEIWRELERDTGMELYTATGGLILSDSENLVSVHGSANFLETTCEAARRYDIEHEILDTAEIRKRFPQFRLSGVETAYYEPGAGFLRPDNCIQANLRLALKHGAAIRTDESVDSYEVCDSGECVRVRTNSGEYDAGSLIVCAGAWVARFVDQPLAHLFKVYPQILYWFDVGAAYEAYAPGRFPVFIWASGTEFSPGIYGFPAIDGRGGGMKVATEQNTFESAPSEIEADASKDDREEMYRRHVEGRLSGVGPTCLRAVRCRYTVTPDSHFVIDRHPSHSRVIIASPCSGHGFKHSAAIGEALAELALDGTSHLDIGQFALSRFGVGDGI